MHTVKNAKFGRASSYDKVPSPKPFRVKTVIYRLPRRYAVRRNQVGWRRTLGSSTEKPEGNQRDAKLLILMDKG